MTATVEIGRDWYLPRISGLGGWDHSTTYVKRGVWYVPDVSQADLDAAVAKYDHNARLAELPLAEVQRARSKAYPPIGDQLDAIWKELNSRRMKGEDLVQGADDILGKVLSVKSKHPKP